MKTSWCKGHTKETDERITKRSKKISESLKRYYSIHKHWIKGLTKDIDTRVLNISKSQKGKPKSLAHKLNIAKSKIGNKNPMWGKIGSKHHFFGKHHTQESMLKIREKLKEKFPNGRVPWNKGKVKETDERIGKATIKRRETITKIGGLGGWSLSKETKKKISQIIAQRWQGEMGRNILRSLLKKPTKPEQKLIDLLAKYIPNEYKYVGDGEFILGGKCPDFLNVNGKKKLIEVFGNYWHRGENPQNRIDFFKQYGFDCLVLWENELNQPELADRIREFTWVKNC